VVERDGGTTRRLLVVLSDGFAYDHGYEGSYGEADARRALVEARRRGTACLCLSMGAPTDTEALRRVFGTAAHARVPRLEDLPAMVGPLFRFALNLNRSFTLNPGDNDHPRTLSFNARTANLLNHTNVTSVNQVLSTTLGQPTVAEPARRIDFGARFEF